MNSSCSINRKIVCSAVLHLQYNIKFSKNHEKLRWLGGDKQRNKWNIITEKILAAYYWHFDCISRECKSRISYFGSEAAWDKLHRRGQNLWSILVLSQRVSHQQSVWWFWCCQEGQGPVTLPLHLLWVSPAPVGRRRRRWRRVSPEVSSIPASKNRGLRTGELPPCDHGHQTAAQAQHQHHLRQTRSSKWPNVSQNI